MIPYADLTYWGVLLYPTLPTFFVGWGRRLRQSWILLATLGMLVVQYPAERVLGQNAAVREIWLVVGFGVFEYLLARGWLAFRQRSNARWLAWSAFGLALSPLIASRLLASQSNIGFIGISYLTFRSLDVLIAIEDRLIAALSPTTYLAYVLFFPTISAGPIDRYRRFVNDWLHSRNRASSCKTWTLPSSASSRAFCTSSFWPS